MTTPITHLTSIYIEGLWGEIDIEWELDPKVNVLVGRNGSGKTTLLNIIESVITEYNPGIQDLMASSQIEELDYLTKRIPNFTASELIFNTEKNIRVTKERVEDALAFINKRKKAVNIEAQNSLEKFLRSILDSESQLDTVIQVHTNIFTPKELENSKNLKFTSVINLDKVSTFEFATEDLENTKNHKKSSVIKEPFIRTQLDYLLNKLIDGFKSYRLTLRNLEKQATNTLDEKINELTLKSSASQAELEELRQALADKNQKIADINQQKQTFIQKVNFLFADTGKEMDFDENNAIVFKKADKIIQAYQLSSGEKQLLIILLTIVLQQNKPYIVLMDEPEVSLHLAWQLDLIEIIQTLNPNCQLIIATHSPGIFSDGWNDKLVEIEDIIKTS